MKNNLAFALDYSCITEAIDALTTLSAHIGYAKIGLELFTSEGPNAIKAVQQVGLKVFLDLKLHDIPQTVERAVANACSYGVQLLTIHVLGGCGMIERAIARANAEATGLRLVGVTVLTSLDDSDLALLGMPSSSADQTLRLAKLAYENGVNAFVCSPREVSLMRRAFGPDVMLMVPGIRPAGAAQQDQKRVATAQSAIRDGADVLVVGRSIRDAPDPVVAVRQMCEEINVAKSEEVA